MSNYYEILQVKRNASPEQIRKAYLSLVKNFHPDVYKGDKIFAEKKTAEITLAHSILKDNEKRQEYDFSSRVNTADTIYQDYVKKTFETEKKQKHSKEKPNHQTSRKLFKNTKRRSFFKHFLKRLFTSKLFYSLLFVFAIEALIIYFVYVNS